MEKYLIHSFETYTREPIIRRLKSGVLICTFLTGGEYDPLNENHVQYCKSYDDGKTWTEPKVMFKHSLKGTWCSEIFTECEKPFAVIATYDQNSHYRELETFYSYCDDDGENWTEPVSFKGHINGCSLRQGIRLSNNNILFPVYWQETCKGFDLSKSNFPPKPYPYPFPFRSGVAISEDNGETYKRYGYLYTENVLWEPNCVELEPGHIIMYARAGIPDMYTAESFDYGRTWTEAKVSGIPNCDTKITLIKVRDKILLINNFGADMNKDGEAFRYDLCIYISTDGKNFKYVTNLEDKNEIYYYPHAYADDNQSILYVAYENSRQHWLKKFTYEELGI